MRLVCPNCSAQYEIDVSMIPAEGRDVQCSNCGHTWFELPGLSATDEATPEESAIDPSFDDGDGFGPDDAKAEDTDFAEPDTVETENDFSEPSEPVTSEPNDFDEDDPDESSLDTDVDVDVDVEEDTDADVEENTDGGFDERPEDTNEDRDTEESDRFVAASAAIAAAAGRAREAAANPTGGRRPADAADLDILREEAARELSQRRAPPSETIETQTDLGLDTIRKRNTPSRALRARMAHMGEETDNQDAASPDEPPRSTKIPHEENDAYEEPRRDLLPDIDEINSTLKPKKAVDLESRRRSGFRVGFFLVLFAVLAAIFAYAQAPAIARALPNTEPGLMSYVDHANALRDWVQGLIGN